MMRSLYILTALLLVAGISAQPNQEVSNAQTVTGPQVDQSSHVGGHTSAFVAGGGSQQPFGVPHHQQHQSAFAGGPVGGFEQDQPMAAHYYSPAGVVQVVGGGQQTPVTGEQQSSGAFKPTGTFQTVGHYAAGAEQYGQPESAGVPPNYKPFGSWGLYIGGNPADGYYTNYYKALSGSVADKQQAGEQATAVAPVAPTTRGATSAQTFASNFGPAGVASPQMKQGPFYPSNQAASYQDQSYQGYPYGEYYTPADLNSGSRVTVQSVPSTYSSASSYSSGGPSPVSATGFAFEEPTGAAMFYAGGGEFNAKKSTGPAAFGKGVPASPAKGYYQAQQRAYYAGHGYQAPQQASGASSFEAAAPAAPSSGAYQHHQQQQSTYQAAAPQVVAYPVPVGSQLVGSQPGVDGAFQPYGVHAFTRYAVKPTVVSVDQTAYYQSGVHSSPVAHFPVYKQYYGYPQPLGFYGYPLSQLHYSSGASAFAPAPAAAQAAPGSPAAAAAAASQQQHAANAAAAAASVPHPGPEPTPAQAPAPASGPAPGPAPGQAQGVSVAVEHSGPGPVGPVHAPVAFFEAASSEKSETSHSDQATEKKVKVQPSQEQPKNN